ncbi:odorant receptor 83a-like [Pectinophora gossypiella]|uniref:odorant receptor 83a-like n=1 Tax=Pectinophora gossypiella TaxID=13191 RepID=UPI00214EF1B6|nr:odorant receptor 83a-like [Pectinophora gossypiella]
MSHQHRNILNERTKNVVQTLNKVIRMTGLWETPNRTFYWMAQVAKICFVTTILTQAIALFMAREDSKMLFHCFSVLTFCGMGFLKMQTLRANRQRWQLLLLRLDNLEDEELNIEDKDSRNCFASSIQMYTKRFHTIYTLIYRVYNATLVIFVTSPFIETGYWYINNLELDGYPHVLPGWSPWDHLSIYLYLITIFAEIISAIYCVVVHIAFDLTTLGLMIFMSGQFKMLRCFSEGIGGDSAEITYRFSHELDARAHFRIVNCHRTLSTLDSSVAELDKLIKDILGIYYLVAVLTLCSVALRLSLETMSGMQAISLMQYTGGTIIQLFLFCYFGDMVLNTSSVGVGEGPFVSSYWKLSAGMRREVALLAIGMAHVRRLRAGPFNSLDLPSFIQIMRTAYSYYAVLRKKSN